MMFVCNSNMHAQSPGKKEKLEALRIAFITKELNLTSAEAQTFWPVYNEYQDKTEAARKAFRQQYKKNVDINALTEKEADSYIAAEIELKQREASLFKEYMEKIKKVVGAKKTAKLRKAEEEFKQELLKILKNGGTGSD